MLIFYFSLLKYTYHYNYRSHISLQVSKLAKSAGVQILIFPTVSTSAGRLSTCLMVLACLEHAHGADLLRGHICVIQTALAPILLGHWSFLPFGVPDNLCGWLPEIQDPPQGSVRLCAQLSVKENIPLCVLWTSSSHTMTVTSVRYACVATGKWNSVWLSR